MKKYLLIVVLIGAVYSVYHFKLVDKLSNLLTKQNNNKIEETTGRELTQNKHTNTKKRPRRNNPYYLIEKYAFNTPKSKTETIKQLANYLSKGAKNEYEKARIAYAWVAKYISYDDNAFNTNSFGDLSAEGVLKSRTAVCEGFSNLYKSLCDSMGLKTIKITGYAKGYGYNIGDKFTDTDHAWNAVKIDGEWKLVDVTWGEGYGQTENGKLKCYKEYNPYWFATDPYQFLFKHLPENKEEQFIRKPLSLEQFERLVYANQGLFEIGISAKFILEKSLEDPNFTVPKAWSQDYDLQVIDAELQHDLSSSKEYSFKIKSSENVDIACINENNWTHFKKEKEYFVGSIKPINGKLTVSAKLKGFDDSYWTILKYEVK